MNDLEVEWIAPEFEHRPKEVDWYWKSIILATIILSVAVWQKNYLFAALIIIGEILIIIWGNREPREVKFKIGERGIHIGDMHFYPYRTIESYSLNITENSPWDDIIIHHKHHLVKKIRVKIPKETLNKATNSLSLVLPETEHEESFIDALEHYFGF